MLSLLGGCFVDDPPMLAMSTGTTDVPATTGTTAALTSSSSSGSGSGTAFEPSECGEAVLELPEVAQSVMLVLDKSGSMANQFGLWDHDLDPNTPTVTRWSSLFTAVSLTANRFDLAWNLGAVLFPAKTATASNDEFACIVDAEPTPPLAPMNAAALLAALPGPLTDTTMMQGGSAATRGINVAVKALAEAPGPRFMVLVTDGAANCPVNAADELALFEVYDEGLPTTVAAAAAMGITTHVVGINISQVVSGAVKDGAPDGINNYEKMNQVAIAGGAPRAGDEKFYNTTDEGALEAALDTIAREILTCTIALSPAPKYPEGVEVIPYGANRLADCGAGDGWLFAPKVGGGESLQIQLCGKACADYQASGKVEVQYRCPAAESP